MKRSEQLKQIYDEKIPELIMGPDYDSLSFSYIQPVNKDYEETKIPKLKTVQLYHTVCDYPRNGNAYTFTDWVGYRRYRDDESWEFTIEIPFTFFDDPEAYNKKVKKEFDAIIAKIEEEKRVEQQKLLEEKQIIDKLQEQIEIELLKKLQEKYKDVV